MEGRHGIFTAMTRLKRSLYHPSFLIYVPNIVLFCSSFTKTDQTDPGDLNTRARGCDQTLFTASEG